MSPGFTKQVFGRRTLFSKGARALGGAIALGSTNLSLAQLPAIEQAARVPLRIIVVESQTEAQRIVDQLKKGEDFADLAAEKSIDPTANQGGYVGNLQPENLRPELRDALKGIRPGEFSPVTRIPEGYAIIKIDLRDQPPAQEVNPAVLSAMTAPGAARLSPDVDGLNEAFSIFYTFPGKPEGWERENSPIAAAELRQQSLSAGIRNLKKLLITDPKMEMQNHFVLAQLYAFQGQMDAAIEQWKACSQLASSSNQKMADYLDHVLAIAFFHKSEMENDIYSNPGKRCLFPMSASLRYSITYDSQQSVDCLLKYLKRDPDDLAARWLLNLASMTLGAYPQHVPNKNLIPLDIFQSKEDLGRFEDVAEEAGLKVVLGAGGIIIDDFENRGLFDVVLSEWGNRSPHEPLRYYHNNGDGTFSDQTERSGLLNVMGGLNILQTDYNNDGRLDILVLRGAWSYPEPMTLLRGNGDGTFTDVTKQAGLTDLVATQAAVWADINNDGFLDLFVGNEKGPSHLYLNKGDGTFEDISESSGVDRIAFTKGVAAGDYDNDGYVDFYVSNMANGNFLYHNEHNNTFAEVARQAGVRDSLAKGFATWFFDFDNDGWLDILVCSYYPSVEENIRTYLHLPLNAATLKLYKNSRDGTFEDVTQIVGLNKVFMPMGANFGDVDNDGFLDVYLGTGNPSYGGLVPNVLLRNDGGKSFIDITTSSGTGELHKGHGIAFADMSNSGQQDILAVIGGATPGDRHAFRFFKNPGNANDWIRIKLEGVKSNRTAMGAQIKVTTKNESRGSRQIFRTVGSGGSFGANPLEQHFGLGAAATIEKIEVWWPTSKTRQEFANVGKNQVITIKEFATQFTAVVRPRISMARSAPGRSKA